MSMHWMALDNTISSAGEQIEACGLKSAASLDRPGMPRISMRSQGTTASGDQTVAPTANLRVSLADAAHPLVSNFLGGCPCRRYLLYRSYDVVHVGFCSEEEFVGNPDALFVGGAFGVRA